MKYPYYCPNCHLMFDSHPTLQGPGPWRCYRCHTIGVVHIPTWEASCLAAGQELQRKLKKARLVLGVRS